MKILDRLARALDSYLGTSLGPHKVRSDTDGSLICRAVIARSGFQDYLPRELGIEGTEPVPVYRPKEELQSEQFLASIEGCAVTEDHPHEFITPDSHKWVAHGFAVNAGRGPDTEDGEVTIMADLHLKDTEIIRAVENGKVGVSCGYTYTLADENGRLTMRGLKANHIAVVEKARAGEVARITDAAPVSENKESPIFSNELATDSEGDEDMASPETQALLNKMCGLLEKLAAKPDNREAEDAECNCGADEGDTHHKKCPMSVQQAEDVDEIFSDRSTQPDKFGATLIPVGNGSAGITNPTQGRDAYLQNIQALENLRSIRPAIESHMRRTGDKAAMREFNAAVIGINNEIKAYERGAVRTERPSGNRTAMDDFNPHAEQIRAGVAYEAELKKYHRQPTPADLVMTRPPSESPYFRHQTVDSAPKVEAKVEDISFDEQVRRARETALAR